MSEAIPVVIEDGVIRPLAEIKAKGRWRGELRVFEEKSSESKETLKDLRVRVVLAFKQNFPHIEFDPELLSLIGVDYAPESAFEEDRHLVMDYLGDKYAKP